ncbi:MAG: 50S ribosomal protein L35ae [Candidatus Bathyarchaeota archaeon]|nr:50S ribosomal protein L35ae [Candidatus Bathyarchaeota archaeon]
MSQKIYGRITNFRIGPKAQASKECLIEFSGIDSEGLAGKLVGQRVTWKNQTSTMTGKIMRTHGKNGMVLARFVHGVPGQAIGTTVELIS